MSPEVKSDPIGMEFSTPERKYEASCSYTSQQSQWSPMGNLRWWSPSKSGGSVELEQDDKGKGSPVEGVVEPGALIMLPPPREFARPEMVKKSLVPVGSLDEEEWVTVYGFSLADTNLVLREFENCGLILKHVPGPRNANWMHILYQITFPPICADSSILVSRNLLNQCDAHKALSKNGMEINGVLIIGVKPVDYLMQQQTLNERLNNQGFMPLPPPPSNRNSESNGFKVSPYPYYLQNGSSNARQSGGTMATPAKSVVSKVTDLLFDV